MPIIEFKCVDGHVTEEFFKTISAAEKVEFSICETCNRLSARCIVSPPLPAHFYGNPAGYDKPSPTKRYNTKTVSRKEGNSSAIG